MKNNGSNGQRKALFSKSNALGRFWRNTLKTLHFGRCFQKTTALLKRKRRVAFSGVYKYPPKTTPSVGGFWDVRNQIRKTAFGIWWCFGG